MTVTTRSEPRAVRRTERRESALAWLYYSPTMIALIVWVYAPLVFTVILSFLNWDLVAPEIEWIGLENYETLVTEPEFGTATWNTVKYALLVLPFATVIPCALAIALWKRPGPLTEFYRMLLFLPVVLAPVANALAWQFILDPLHGIVNQVLTAFGGTPINWLGNPDTALPTIVLVTAPKVIALNTLLFGAALANIDRRTVDAARMDDATEGEITRAIILPQLRRPFILLGMLSMVVVWPWLFTNIGVLTRGGPSGATDNVYYRLYTYGFTFFEAGTASAAAIAITLGFGLLLTVYTLISRSLRATR